MEIYFPRRLYFETANLDPREGRPSIALRMDHESGDDVLLVELRPRDNAEHLRFLNFLTDRYDEIVAAFDWDRVRIRDLFEAAGFVLEAEASEFLNIFEAIDTGDVRKIIDVVDPAFKKAAAAASAHARAKGIEVADGRPGPRCPQTGQPMFRGVRSMTITYQGRQAAFDMPGWYCDTSDQSIHTGEDMEVSDRALNQLKVEVAADDILKGMAAASREPIEDDFAGKLHAMRGTISRDIDLEFNDEPAKPHVASLSHWIRAHQPSGFGGATVLALIQDGRIEEILDYLDAIDGEGFA